jgi:hypothetical protein
MKSAGYQTPPLSSRLNDPGRCKNHEHGGQYIQRRVPTPRSVHSIQIIPALTIPISTSIPQPRTLPPRPIPNAALPAPVTSSTSLQSNALPRKPQPAKRPADTGAHDPTPAQHRSINTDVPKKSDRIPVTARAVGDRASSRTPRILQPASGLGTTREPGKVSWWRIIIICWDVRELGGTQSMLLLKDTPVLHTQPCGGFDFHELIARLSSRVHGDFLPTVRLSRRTMGLSWKYSEWERVV